ncbi:MAG: hypothetical protein XD43_0859 [Thermococcales archaeon 44_46]|jgi:hypothetical protein|nr:MAG: hypothetical protein XD43_0859 [Thermococcales archaeon 44_46]HIH73141.1 hypothetical protein [Thermococcaceae archaeon]
MDVKVEETFKVGDFELLKLGGDIIIERGRCGKKPCGHTIFAFEEQNE